MIIYEQINTIIIKPDFTDIFFLFLFFFVVVVFCSIRQVAIIRIDREVKEITSFGIEVL